MRKGLSANNFSNNYVGLQTENILYGYGRYEGDLFGLRKSTKTFEMLNALSVQWGMQRRLGRYSYFDVNFTLPILPTINRLKVPAFYTPIGVNIKLGLGW